MDARSRAGTPPCRLHLMRAEDAPVACVIRRGPTRWFHVALWDFGTGRVEHGAWTRIRLYPHRCALSSDGRRLAVFALGGEWGPYFAVSHAPWLFAVAAWRTVGAWTSGAHFGPGHALVLSGCTEPTPFHGSYPDGVACEPTDRWWIRGALFRELRTGWSMVPQDGPGAGDWLDRIPAPVAATPHAVVAVRPGSAGSDRALVLVSLAPGQREYYLRDGSDVVPLPAVTRAEWGVGDDVLVTTDAGHLQILDRGLEPRWDYDMNRPHPEPRAAPAWATLAFDGPPAP